MRKLSLITILNLIFVFAWGQENPHGEKLSFSCTDCHTTSGWKFEMEKSKFDHNKTEFKLEGQHGLTNCSECHTSLVFNEAKSNCVDCHSDLHNTTVGTDCARCHTPKSWIVDNITEIHQMGRFPLLGAHNSIDCSACHTSASQLEFEPLGVECIDCHQDNYLATTTPDHSQAGYSTNCIECHKIEAHEWSSSGINHDFFPLNEGHEIADCSACHKEGLTGPISPDCYSCHQNDYNSATNPTHQNAGFSTDCVECHTLSPDWKPANFTAHDGMFFPIYSGEHKGEWDACTDCHTQPDNYSAFSCIDCHEHNRSEMDDEHNDVNGYSYNSMACFSCHPGGSEKSAFTHSSTNFILKGAHTSANCLDCHTTSFSGTSAECNSCHTASYNQAANPNHVNAGIAVECETCHNETDWKPSLFNHTTTTGFELSNGHSGKQCSECHTGTTANASSDCVSCHQQNYNNAKDHVASNFPTDCTQCHNNSNWADATFDHNTTNFPLTGSHVATECSACHTDGYAGTSSACSACHTDNYNGAQNPVHTTAGISTECETCHETTAWAPSKFDHTTTTGFELSNGHSGKQCSECHTGTTANASSDCVSCHQQNYNNAKDHVASNFPTDCTQCHNNSNWADATFDHNTTNFPLTGSHVATECSACHTDGYAGTTSLCSGCHQSNYNTTSNPNHTSLGFSTSCGDCHTTNPDWKPAAFSNHNDYYALNGAHATVASDCYLCHSGNYTNTPNTCFGCHSNDYNNTTDPAHATAQFSTDCITCHTEKAWKPSTFDHDNQYFPIYSGEHKGEWNSCTDCHTQAGNYAVFSCLNCHEHNLTDMADEHKGVNGYVYNSTNCLTCHPNGKAD